MQTGRVSIMAKSDHVSIGLAIMAVAIIGGRSRHGRPGIGCLALPARLLRSGQRATTVSRGPTSTVLQGRGRTPMAGSIGRTSAGSRLSGLGQSVVSAVPGSSSRSISIFARVADLSTSLESGVLASGCHQMAIIVVLVPIAACKALISSIGTGLAVTVNKIATISRRCSQVCQGRTIGRITKRLSPAETTASKVCRTAKAVSGAFPLAATGPPITPSLSAATGGRSAIGETGVLFSAAPSSVRPFCLARSRLLVLR